MDYRNKQLIVFDLDGTLTESKSPLTDDMAQTITKLLEKKKVAIIGGGRWEQFQKQFLKGFSCPESLLGNLFLFPTTATAMYRYDGGWKNVYAITLTSEERAKIFNAFEKAFVTVGYEHPEKAYGQVLEDRGSQVTFSALGQDIVDVLGAEGVAMKEAWGKLPWREKIAAEVEKLVPEFEVRRGGLSSIDVTKKGIDKAYGLKQIEEHLQIPVGEMFFVGDAIFPGGNDYAVVRTGVEYLKVSGPAETKTAIEEIIKA